MPELKSTKNGEAPSEKTYNSHSLWVTLYTSIFLDTHVSLAPTRVRPSVDNTFGFPFCQLTVSVSETSHSADIVADMEVDKVADKVANMVADMPAPPKNG